jgi:hypothetical protein
MEPLQRRGSPYYHPSESPQLAIKISDLRRNLEALFRPRLKIGVRKLGKPAPLKLLAIA